MLGGFLGGLYRADLALLVREGSTPVTPWRDRKREIGALTSARWAGTVTRAANTQYRLGMRALRAERDSLRRRIDEIGRRAAVPVGWATVTTLRPYRSEAQRFQKLRRRAALADRLRKVEARVAQGRPRVVVGGSRLWRHRGNLDAAGLTETQWREAWSTARMFLTADGETGRRYGNDTIKVSPEGVVQIYIPTGLRSRVPAGVAVTSDGTRVVLAAPVKFVHRADVWADRVTANQAVAYTFTYDPDARRWQVKAAWTHTVTTMPLSFLHTRPTLAVDFNADHFAAWIVDPAGNPVGPPATFECELAGLSAAARDALLRHTLTRILTHAKRHGCASVSVENLNFTSTSTGKDDPQTTRRLRRTVAGMPTAQFRDRLAAMAATAGVALVAVDPAYTSRWGRQHWVQPLRARHSPAATPATTSVSRSTTPISVSLPRGSQVSVTGHHSAAVVIGRRMYGHKARRKRMNGPLPAQRSGQGQPVTSQTRGVTTVPVEPDRAPSALPVQVFPSQPSAGRGRTTAGSPTPFTGQTANTG